MKFTILMKLFFMLIPVGAVITANILGNMRQQLNKTFVFFKWKGLNVVRSYTIPANPNTVLQQAQRNKFKALLPIAQNLLILIIQPFWRKLAVYKSQFNAWFGMNIKLCGYPINYSNLVMSSGSLLMTNVTSATYNVGTGIVDVVYSTSVSANQLAGDLACAIIIDTSTNKIYTAIGTAARSAGTIAVTTETGLSVPNLHSYLFFYRNLGKATEIISNSGNRACI
jgi:hypothetical protein